MTRILISEILILNNYFSHSLHFFVLHFTGELKLVLVPKTFKEILLFIRFNVQMDEWSPILLKLTV